MWTLNRVGNLKVRGLRCWEASFWDELARYLLGPENHISESHRGGMTAYGTVPTTCSLLHSCREEVIFSAILSESEKLSTQEMGIGMGIPVVGTRF